MYFPGRRAITQAVLCETRATPGTINGVLPQYAPEMGQQDFPRALVLRYPPEYMDWHEFSCLFGRLTVLKVLRGYDCPVTKQETQELTQYLACFEKMNVAVVAICEESQGCKEFLASGMWCGDLYIDPYRDVCRASRAESCGGGQRLKLSGFRRKTPKHMSLFQLGGTYIITPDCQIVFKHEPKNATDPPSMGLILFMCHSLTASQPHVQSAPKPSRAAARRSWMKYVHPGEEAEITASRRPRRQSVCGPRAKPYDEHPFTMTDTALISSLFKKRDPAEPN